MTHYVKIDTVDMHTSCPVASKIKSLEDTIKSLEGTLALTDKQRRSAERTCDELKADMATLAYSNDLLAEQRDSAEKALKLEQAKSKGLKERLEEAAVERQNLLVDSRILQTRVADLTLALVTAKNALQDVLP